MISTSFRDWALRAAFVVHKTHSQYFKKVTEHGTQFNSNPRACCRNPSGKGVQPIALKVLPRLTVGPGPVDELPPLTAGQLGMGAMSSLMVVDGSKTFGWGSVSHSTPDFCCLNHH